MIDHLVSIILLLLLLLLLSLLLLFMYFSRVFSHQHQPMIFTGSLSDNKSAHVSRTLPIILADLSNAIVWIVSICLPISYSSSSFSKSWRIVPVAPVTIGITVTFIFHNFLSSPERSKNLSDFSDSLIFTQWSARMAKFMIHIYQPLRSSRIWHKVNF